MSPTSDIINMLIICGHHETVIKEYKLTFAELPLVDSSEKMIGNIHDWQ